MQDIGANTDDDDARADSNIVHKQDIAGGQFYLRAGIGRKATGSYLHARTSSCAFWCARRSVERSPLRSPDDDPNPVGILALKVVDPATGSGHFLVQACRFLGEALYAACRLCDTQATAAESRAALAEPGRFRGTPGHRTQLLRRKSNC